MEQHCLLQATDAMPPLSTAATITQRAWVSLVLLLLPAAAALPNTRNETIVPLSTAL